MPGPRPPKPMAMAPPMYRTASGSVIPPNTLILLRQSAKSSADDLFGSRADSCRPFVSLRARRPPAQRLGARSERSTQNLVADRTLELRAGGRVSRRLGLFLVRVVSMVVSGGNGNVDQGQHREDQRLDCAEQELQEEENHRNQHRNHEKPDLRGNGVHDTQQRLTGKHIAEESGRERDDS